MITKSRAWSWPGNEGPGENMELSEKFEYRLNNRQQHYFSIKFHAFYYTIVIDDVLDKAFVKRMSLLVET